MTVASIFFIFCMQAQGQSEDAHSTTPKITLLQSQSPYPDANSNFKLDVFGENFGPVPSRPPVTVYLNDFELTVVQPDSTVPDPKKGPYGVYRDDRHIQILHLPSKEYSGVLKVKVRADSKFSEVSSIALSGLSIWSVRTLAALISLALFAIPLGFVWACYKTPYTINGRPLRFIDAVFLDPQTDTYSLSKFQFYLWTLAGIFGYSYLTISKSFVQGVFQFAPIPDSLPGIIFISGATTAVAVGITSAKGTKGAGNIYPSFADFVTSGGIVLAERFQFFVWTVLGVVCFIALTAFSNPAQLQELPHIPEGFLYLMGISSFGYLGGKLARKPGPIIDNIDATKKEETLTFTIKGSFLSRDAGVKIDGQEVALAIRDQSTDNPFFQIVVPEGDTASSADYAKVLQFDVNISKTGPNPKLANLQLGVQYKLTIINPDGAMATWPFVCRP